MENIVYDGGVRIIKHSFNVIDMPRPNSANNIKSESSPLRNKDSINNTDI